jgi:hypothetical protein
MTNPCAIVDLGGSSGWCWDYLQNSLPEHRVSSYVVVETEAVVDYMKKSGIHHAPVNYRSLNSPLDPCDLLYCNSTLQYFGGSAIPYRFLGLNKLLQELSHYGYTAVTQLPYASPVLGVIKPLEMGNFPEAKQLRYSSSILLKKFEGQ